MNGSGRPTAVIQRVDMSVPGHGASAVHSSSEAELILAYASTAASRLETRPCVCGGAVTADRERPSLGVAAHQFTSRHIAWREAQDVG